VTLQPRTLGLLAYLARQPTRQATRERLCGLLWPEEPVENGRHNLRQLLWSLRQATGADLLSGTRDEVTLLPGLICDVHRLLESLDGDAALDAASVLPALAVYRGAFMDGVESAGGAEFEDWLLGEREYLHRRFSKRLLEAARSPPSDEAATLATELLERLLRSDPLDESVVAALMSLYEESGEKRLALRVYRSFAAALERELEADPPPHLQTWAQRLSGGKDASSLDQEEAGRLSAPAEITAPRPAAIALHAMVYVLFHQGEGAPEALAVHERVKLLGECHYFAERLASRFGVEASERRGHGHLFLFGMPQAAVEFGHKLWEAWENLPAALQRSLIQPRIAAHVGEATPVTTGRSWIGRGVQAANRVALAAPWEGLVITENLLDLLPESVYAVQSSARVSFAGDHLPERTLYRIAVTSEGVHSPQQGIAPLFLKALSFIDTEKENGPEEEAAYRAVLDLDPSHAEAHNNLGVLLRRRGNHFEAAVHYRSAISFRPGYAEAHYNYAVLLESMGSVSAAVEHYRAALQVRPDYVDAQMRYAVLLVQRGQRDEAARRYQRVLQLRPAFAEAHNNYAILLEDVGDREAARKHYQLAIHERPEYVEAHYNLALHFEADGNDEQAAVHYQRALELSPEFVEARSNFASLLHRSGNLHEALLHLRLAVEARPNDPEANYNYAVALEDAGEHALAAQYFQVARDFTPTAAPFTSTVER
jgi:DNA-binding SARP family transcriptional activator/tetratricopeptide (TPR) repeat protein